MLTFAQTLTTFAYLSEEVDWYVCLYHFEISY